MTGAIRERAFHAWLRRTLPSTLSPRLPMGDDAAAISVGSGRHVLLTTDALSEGTHFLRTSPPEAVGGATIAASLSDLASKGATPRAALLDLLVPRDTPQRWCERVTDGAAEMCERFGAEIVGGDTKPAAGRSVVGTLLGLRRGSRLPARRDARPGDIVATTGTVGRGGIAARALDGSHPTSRQLRALLTIEPRVAEGVALAPRVRAMTDSSDGLAESVRLIAEASRTKIVLDESRLPWAPGLAVASIEPGQRIRTAFYGGDYELVATLRPDQLVAAQAAVQGAGGELTAIGSVERGSGAWLRSASAVPLRRLGPPTWDPFASRPSGP